MFKQDFDELAFFRGMSPQQVRELEPLFDLCTFAAGEVIFEQGQPAEYLYVLSAGEVLVQYKPYDGPQLTVARVLPGNVFGWSAALRRRTYSSGSSAVLASEAYRITRAQLMSICNECPATGREFLDRLTRAVAERYHSMQPQVLDLLSDSMDPDANGGKPPND